MLAVRNQAVTVQIEHDGVDTTEYALVVNGAEAARKPFDPAGVNFQNATGFVPGSYDIAVEAIGPAGIARSELVTLIVAPGVPSQPRIVVAIG